MSSLPKSYDPTPTEQKWRTLWKEGRYFEADPTSSKNPYCIVIPPPNVTGVLHMGHALVDTLQDVLIRWKRMLGYEVLWVPGTDHAGIATQTVVERHLFAETGKRRKEFSREEFLDHIWAWKEKSQETILSQLERLGCSCDWSRLRFTMDEGCNKAVRATFEKMYREGLIYRGDYLVNWDPVAQTALSDDEVDYEERPSFLWHIHYPFVDGKGGVVVATTRPETLLGDVAVAVHPSDERYASSIGKELLLPLTGGRKIPLLADPFVDPQFGTGAVKITPAHDFNDFEMGQRHNLPLINLLTPDGRLNEKGGEYQGLTMEEARPRVLAELKRAGLLVKEEPHTLRVGHSYRSRAVVEPYLSKQWFVKMGPFKEKLLSAVREKRVTLLPPHWEATYTRWIEHLRDWCISRQIWWGHQIPIWYSDDGGVLCYAGEGLPPKVVQEPQKWRQDPDVLDTWFSSALWPFSALGWPEKSPEMKKFYPNSTLITGHDILFFWVARMILMGEYTQGEVPFKETFLHGLIYGKSYWRTEANGTIRYIVGEEKRRYDLGESLPPDVSSKWEKMSKSKGNVLDPLEIIDDYGTDALRFTLTASVTQARQIDLDRRRFEESKNFVNKIWNGARFALSHIEGATFETGLDLPHLPLEDRWILSRLTHAIEEIHQHLSSYAFDKAAATAYQFFWDEFCSIYLESAKPALFGKSPRGEAGKAEKKKLLAILLGAILRLLHPITPFITEELFSLLKLHLPSPSAHNPDPWTADLLKALESPACLVAPYPQPLTPRDLAAEEELTLLLQAVHAIRNIRAEMQLPPGEKTELLLIEEGPSPLKELLLSHKELLQALTPTLSISLLSSPPTSFGAGALVGSLRLIVPIPESLREKERLRLLKEKEKLEKLLASTQAKLSLPELREKAPPHVLEKLEQARRETERQLEEIEGKLREGI